MLTIDAEYNAIATSNGAASQPISLVLDPARYRADVDQFDISEEQKQELLTILWSIMRSFVELGFDVDVCSMLLAGDKAIPVEHELE